MSTIKKTLEVLEDAVFYDPSDVGGTIYLVELGDTLSEIVSDHYDLEESDPEHKTAMASALYFNQHIDDPDYIRLGDAIRLMPLPTEEDMKTCTAENSFLEEKNRYTRDQLEPMPSHRSAYIRDRTPKGWGDEPEAFRILALLEEHHSLITTAVGGGVNAFGNIVHLQNADLIRQVSAIYNDKAAGKISQEQHDNKHKKILADLKHRIGPFDEWLLGGPVNQQIRINHRKSIPATYNIDRHAARIERLSRYATNGGIVLAGGALSCRDIANAHYQQEKNEILVETVAGTLGGAVAGYGMFLILASNPIGWSISLVLGVGTAAAAFGAGKFARHRYTLREEKIDWVDITGVDKLCK